MQKTANEDAWLKRVDADMDRGDIVWFAPKEKHWHSAAPTTAMTHIAIQEALDGRVVEWMERSAISSICADCDQRSAFALTCNGFEERIAKHAIGLRCAVKRLDAGIETRSLNHASRDRGFAHTFDHCGECLSGESVD